MDKNEFLAKVSGEAMYSHEAVSSIVQDSESIEEFEANIESLIDSLRKTMRMTEQLELDPDTELT